MQNFGSRFLLILAVTAACVWALVDKGIRLGLDLEGGASLTYRIENADQVDRRKVLDAIEVIDNRLNSTGVAEVSITPSQGNDEIVVELPGRDTLQIESIKSLIEASGELEFRIVAPGNLEAEERARRDAMPEYYERKPGYRWFPNTETGRDTLVLVPEEPLGLELERLKEQGADPERIQAAQQAYDDARRREIFTGEELSKAEVAVLPTEIVVAFEFEEARKPYFSDFTGAHVGDSMAIILDGKVHSAPTIRGRLPGGGQIEGGQNGFSMAEARELSIVLQSGSTGVKLRLEREEVLGPSLGRDAIRTGQISILIGLVATVLIMLWLYRAAGLVAVVALLLNLVMLVGALAFFRAALTLPGIAGIVLTIGMAVDANVLIFERLRDERHRGKAITEALAAGYDRAMSAIIDGNATTILTAIVLIAMGTGTVRGFGVTLTIGLLFSLFTGIYVTRVIFEFGIAKGWIKTLDIGGELPPPKIDYVRLRRMLTGPSVALMAASLVMFLARDETEAKDLEFVGGQQIIVQFDRAVPIEEVRSALHESGAWREASPVRLDPAGVETDDPDSSNRYLIRVKASAKEQGEEFVEYVEQTFSDRLMPPGFTDFRLSAQDGGAEGRVSFRVHPLTALGEPQLLGDGLVAAGYRDVEVTPVGEEAPRALDVRLTAADPVETAVKADVVTTLRSLEPPVELSDPIPSRSFLAPGRAEELWRQALEAIVVALLVQVVYIRIRFADYKHGFAAVLALAHDAVITLGTVAALDALGLIYAKINLVLIAAFLTLIGYSMNDTIVLFDRIRENLGRSRVIRSQTINDAMNQTFHRSLRTGCTVFAVVLIQFVLNRGTGSVLEGFAWVMVVGTVAGTYSSFFVAGPLLLFLPLYTRKLLANRVLLAVQVLATIVGIVLALTGTGHGAQTWIGAALALNIPIHFLAYFLPWLGDPDPDRHLVAEIRREESDRPLAKPGI